MRQLILRAFISAAFVAAAANAVSAQTEPASQPASTFDPAPILKAVRADPQHADAILSKVSDHDASTLLMALNPDEYQPLSADPESLALTTLARRARDARDAALLKEDKEWNLRTGITVYLASGRRDPAWDALAIDALKTNSSVPAKQSYEKFKAAMDAGCTDPLVRYYCIRRGVACGAITPADAIKQYEAVDQDMYHSPYSPVRKFQVQIRLLKNLATLKQIPPQDMGRGMVAYMQSIDSLPKLRDERPSPLLIREAVKIIQDAAVKLRRDRNSTFHRMYPQLIKLLPHSAIADAFAAQHYIDWAWEARGGDYAYKVSAEQFKLFDERLDLAEKAARAGIEIDPLDQDCARAMITICMGRSYDRPQMELWFSRAMLANPDNLQACEAKLVYLLPQWFGGPTSAVDFGRQCLKYGTVSNRIPAVLLTAHWYLSNRATDKDVYYAQPQVWTDIDAVYKKFLGDEKTEIKQNNLLFDRAKYLHYACQCHQWEAFLKLADEFKDNIDFSVFGSKALYNFYKKKAAAQIVKSPI